MAVIRARLLHLLVNDGRQQIVGRLVSGAVMPTLWSRLPLANLEDKLDQIIDKYESSAYKAEYEFIDYFTRVEDKATQDRLRAQLTEMLLAGTADVAFASPDIEEPLEVDHYILRHGRRRSDELPELLPDEVLAGLPGIKTKDPLQDVHVEAYDASGNRVGQNYRLVSFVVAEIEHDGHRYALSAGHWFLVDQGFAATVDRAIGTIDDLTDQLLLPPWKAGDYPGEGAYNTHLATKRNWRLLDKKNFQLPASYQKIEICDLLTAQKQLLCVIPEGAGPCQALGRTPCVRFSWFPAG